MNQEEIDGTLKLRYVENVSLKKEAITKVHAGHREAHRLVQEYGVVKMLPLLSMREGETIDI